MGICWEAGTALWAGTISGVWGAVGVGRGERRRVRTTSYERCEQDKEESAEVESGGKSGELTRCSIRCDFLARRGVAAFLGICKVLIWSWDWFLLVVGDRLAGRGLKGNNATGG